ncbi:restriction endonuclease subunit S [Helicobacter pylori]|uniref:restriction endonuclease subunit S n=1 Tax=Helicobacter pylori TaxID=210 RepID=UPI001FF6558B|nr:restriction endonuclease subunit S [Helicobacter pylori]MCK0503809.1 restriction endonuclease subunit S [Helicobacter pylori]
MSDNVKLSEVCEILNSNVDKKTKENEQKVKLCNFIDVYNNWAITKYTSKKFMTATATQNEINKFSLKKGYVAITKDSETKDDIGISTYIADNFDNVLLGYHCTLLKPNQKVLNGKFLNAYLSSFYGRKYFSNCASGSGQRYTLTIDVINDLTIPLINIETQQKIARTLSILDQKIENNHKINELLHKILELLYEQYFVRFDFLDENNKPYQTSGGKMKFSKELNRLIPNDFEVKTLGELTQLKVGNKNANHSSNQGKYPFFTCSNNPLRCETYQFEGKHIIISGNGNFYVTHYDGKFDAYQRTYVVNPNNPNHYVLIYLFVKSYTNYLRLQSRGSIIKFITKSDIENIKIVLPNLKTYAKWNNVLKMIENNNQSTQTLTALRDFLLPLLLKQQVKPQ